MRYFIVLLTTLFILDIVKAEPSPRQIITLDDGSQLGPSRLTAFATCVDQRDYLGSADLVAWNKYFGWYQKTGHGAGGFFDNVKENSAGQPVGVSQYGAI